MQKLGNVVLQPGDILLLEAGEDFIKSSETDPNFSFVSELDFEMDFGLSFPDDSINDDFTTEPVRELQVRYKRYTYDRNSPKPTRWKRVKKSL